MDLMLNQNTLQFKFIHLYADSLMPSDEIRHWIQIRIVVVTCVLLTPSSKPTQVQKRSKR